MTPKQSKEARLIREEIKQLSDRRDLIQDCYQEHEKTVDTLIAQQADWALVEENRDKATIYYETFLDTTIHIGRLARKLDDLK